MSSVATPERDSRGSALNSPVTPTTPLFQSSFTSPQRSNSLHGTRSVRFQSHRSPVSLLPSPSKVSATIALSPFKRQGFSPIQLTPWQRSEVLQAHAAGIEADFAVASVSAANVAAFSPALDLLTKLNDPKVKQKENNDRVLWMACLDEREETWKRLEARVTEQQQRLRQEAMQLGSERDDIDRRNQDLQLVLQQIQQANHAQQALIHELAAEKTRLREMTETTRQECIALREQVWRDEKRARAHIEASELSATIRKELRSSSVTSAAAATQTEQEPPPPAKPSFSLVHSELLVYHIDGASDQESIMHSEEVRRLKSELEASQQKCRILEHNQKLQVHAMMQAQLRAIEMKQLVEKRLVSQTSTTEADIK